jgi:hypothetical protein
MLGEGSLFGNNYEGSLFGNNYEGSLFGSILKNNYLGGEVKIETKRKEMGSVTEEDVEIFLEKNYVAELIIDYLEEQKEYPDITMYRFLRTKFNYKDIHNLQTIEKMEENKYLENEFKKSVRLMIKYCGDEIFIERAKHLNSIINKFKKNQ